MSNLQSTLSSSTTTIVQKNYDVFLNFRGEDTRNCFTCHLYEALHKQEIKTFTDDGLEKGDGIWQTLKGAIELSKISVVIFSKDYASSKWCLRELVEIMVRQKFHNQTVIPVFYCVDPSNVRNQTGSFTNSFDQHGKESQEEVQKWREALTEASGLAGWDSSKTRPDTTLVDKIVKDIQKKLMGACTSHDYGALIGEARRETVRHSVGVQEEAGKFEKVSYSTIPEQTCLWLTKGHQIFESRMSILKDIIDALSDSDVNMVGIYGMGGIGKTTLAKEVAREAGPKNGLSLFDKIIFVEVSESPDIKNIQGVVAENLGLQFTEETVPGRANRLCDWLKKEEKILLILDNIWGRIDFEKIGIPIENNRRGLKLLLTTRNRNVLTNQMDCRHNFEVDALNKADAWSLFTSITGTFIEHPDLNSIACEVAEECGGMPVAIVTLAEALKGQGQNEWRDALRELKNPSLKSFGGIAQGVYTSIKLSYDYLENDKLKETFLLCSCMGRTYNASVQDLFRYGLGLGLFENFNTLDEALCNVYVSVNKLKATSLLLDALKSETIFNPPSANERFDMHDIICDVAKSIANVFTVIDAAIPQSWTNENTLINCTSITLHNIDELPEDLELVCPQLKLLYVKSKDSSFRIPDNFFTRMLGLQVLHLIGINLQLLPTSISCLLDLQTLCLDRCELGDIAVIGNLKKLKILSFCYSDIEKLPEEMCHLTKLRLLDLTDCSKLRVIPPNVMSNLKKLEALYMGNTSIQWEIERPNIERSNVSIDELKHLRYLTMLEIHIPNTKMSKGLLSQKLERYKIFIGDKWHSQYWRSRSKTSRVLKLSLNTNENENIFQYLKGIEELELGEVPGATNIFDALDRNGGFPRLKHLDVVSNSHCSCIFESCDALPLLESLRVGAMEVLENICNRPLGANSFLQLRTIIVEISYKLNNIFSSSAVTILPQLQEIQVSYCENMEEIFAIGGQDDANNTEVVHEIELSQLRILTLQNLSRLKSFCCKVKTDSPLQLTSDTQPREILLFNEKVAFPNLQTLDISRIPVEKIWHNLPTKISSCVQNLTELTISYCGNLKELFSSSTVVTEKSREEEMRDTISFLKLNCLHIKGLQKLTTLWSGYYIEFPTLKEFTIGRCPQLDTFIFNDKVACPNLQTLYISYIHVEKIWHSLPPKISSCVQNLTKLTISDCGNLKELFSSSTVVTEESREEEMRHTILFPKLNYLWIQKLEKLTTLWSGYYIEFPTLEEFRIERCPQLDTFIFNDKVVCPNLQTLDIFRIHVEKIWHNLSPKTSSCVQNLTELSIVQCGNLKELFSSSTVVTEESREEEMRDTILFPKLNYLKMFGLKKLTTLWSGYYIEFPTLEEFRILSCPQLDAFIFDDKVRVPSLEKMEIRDMDNLKMIWHNQLDGDSFSKLKSLEVLDCAKLLTLFPSNICGRLLSLQELSVYRCHSLKYLFAASNNVANDEYSPKFLFPKLTSLVLWTLRELRSFYPGRHTVEGPVLKTLKLSDCFIHDTDEEGQTQMQQPRFFVEQAFPCLEELELHGKTIMMMWQGQVPESLFVKLKILEVWSDDYSTNLPLCIIQRFQNLEKFSLDSCSYKEIFSNGEDQTHAATPARIKKLHLRNLKDLKYMWKHDFKQLDLILQNLEGLHIDYCNSLINVMPPSASFQNLTVMEVECCSSLINIGTSSAAKSLVQLTQMKIEGCIKITEVVGNHGDVTEDEIIFQKLKSLSLEDLPSLTSFCSWNVTLKFPSLEELTVNRCPNMKIFSRGVLSTRILKKLQITEAEDEGFWEGDLNTTVHKMFKNMVGFRGIENLTLSKFPYLQVVWHNQFPVSIFGNLKSLVVDNDCSSLRYIPSVALDLVQLQELKITNCGILETIIGTEEERTDDTLFPNLNRLELKDLPKLSRFRIFAGNSIKLPSLTQLWIDNCPNMETFIFDSIDADMPASKENFHRDIQPFFDEKVRFPNLEKMVISGMDNLESIWHNQFLGDSFSFSKLKSVEVNDCQELKTIFPSCICGRLSSLESLTVKSCGLVEEIFNLRWLNLKEKHSIEATTQLRELNVDHMSNLKRIWNKDSKAMLSYGKLQKVTVFLCPNLENLFPASVAKSLLNLVSLEVSDCGLLKEIIAEGGVKEAADRLLFPKVSSLQLHNLPQLRTFYTGKTVEVPCLKRLGLHHCDSVKLFISEFLGFYKTIELEGTNQGLPNLEELQLSGKEITMEWLDQVLGHVFRSLKSLELNDLESTDLSLHFIQKFGSLGKLSLNSSSYKEIFSYGEVKEHPQIKHLVLGGLFDLKQIWKEDSKIDLNFQNLEILEVRSCFNLINLMPSSASFQKLMILRVWGCDGLKNLLTSSTAKSLVLLEKLEVFDCKMLIEVVANEGAVTEEINFRKLKSLSLMYLQSLAGFCSTKHNLNFPILESLVVNECPKMKIFSEGVTSTPKLHKLELNWKAFEQSWEDDVNTITKLNMEKSLKHKRSERKFPPKKDKMKAKIFEVLFKKVVSVATKASGESQEDNGGQQQWSTSPNSAGHAATLVGYNSDADVSES